MAKVVSANPASWGIVDANQISGFRTVATQADLYSIAACILSSSYGDGTTTGADAVGQIWHVQDTNKDFRLISWANRGKAAGWTEELTSESLVGKINAAENKADSAINKANTNTAAIADVKSTANNNALKIKANADSISELKTAVSKKADSSQVNLIADSVNSNTGDIIDIKNKLTKIDTTLYELAPNNTLPSTLADINKNHIYLVKAATADTNNVYAEYIYTGTSATYDATKWEKLGEVTASVDLSGYYTKSEIDKKVTAINKNSISELLIGKQDSTDAVSVVLKRAGGENELKAIIPLVNNASDNKHNGLMSPSMLTKLNGLNNYTHPEHTAHTSGLYKITVDDLGHVSATANVEAKDLKAAGALTSAPAFELGSAVHPDKITINASYNGTNHPVDIAEADSKHPGLISPALYDKLTGITVKDTVTSTGTDAVSGKAVWNHVYNYKIHGDNVGNEVNGTSYTIVARSDDDNTVTCLTDVLTLNYDATNHSNLVVDSAVVWDEDNLKAITNDRLTEILV